MSKFWTEIAIEEWRGCTRECCANYNRCKCSPEPKERGYRKPDVVPSMTNNGTLRVICGTYEGPKA